MAIKKITIKDGSLQKISDTKGKLNLIIYPLDENNDLEPGISLKIYINRHLVQTLMSNEEGIAAESFVINNSSEEVEVQVKDISENIQSRIKIIFESKEKTGEHNRQNNTTQKNYIKNFSNSDEQRVFDEVSTNGLSLGKSDNIKYNTDRGIVLAAVKQNGDALSYVDRFFLTDFNILINAYINKPDSLNKVWTLNKNDLLIIDYIQKIQRFFSSGVVSDDNLLGCIKNNKEVFYFIAKKYYKYVDSNNAVHNIRVLDIIPDNLWNDNRFVLEFSKYISPRIFYNLPEKVKNNEDAFLLSLKNNPIDQGFHFAPKSLQNKHFILNELIGSGKYDHSVLPSLNTGTLDITDRWEALKILVEINSSYRYKVSFSKEEILYLISSGNERVTPDYHLLEVLDIRSIVTPSNLGSFWSEITNLSPALGKYAKE